MCAGHTYLKIVSLFILWTFQMADLTLHGYFFLLALYDIILFIQNKGIVSRYVW